QERLDVLSAEGHPVGRGALGENVTIAGLSWELVQPGARLRLGAVEAEVTAYAPPCKTIAPAFSGKQFTRVSQVVNPGWSRVYVRILVEGDLSVGDSVTVAP
ncbi:MAG: MOSC domain-containing protein, partial [Gemmatimonadaceae bacterium]|nr:MOSC domain-containing protein [Gemmatimonadaceae bacterium]